MPWKRVETMSERMNFISRAMDETESLASLCRQFGISRKTGYKWIERYEEGGVSALEERRSVARSHPNALDNEQLDAVVALRREHPTWGPKKIRARLLDLDPVRDVACASTIGAVLKRQGLVRPRRRRPYSPREFTGLTVGEQANDVWCVDFKGDFRLGDRTRCYPLTVTDFASRYLIACESHTSTQEKPVIETFDRIFREFGLPEYIRSDNGVPFASVGVGGLSRLSIWWIKLGIVPERIEPGHPEQNGLHERMHRTLKAEATKPPGENMAAQQRGFDRFRHIYNDIRPHEGIALKTPTSRYSVSRRSMPATLKSPCYPEPLTTRKLDDHGRLTVFGRRVEISRLLANEELGLEDIDDKVKVAYFGHFRLGEVRFKADTLILDRSIKHPKPGILL